MTCRANGETCTSVEVVHQGANSGKIMCIHSCCSIGPGCWKSDVWREGETPKFGTVCFSPSSEKDIVVLRKYCDCLFFKHYAKVVVA